MEKQTGENPGLEWQDDRIQLPNLPDLLPTSSPGRGQLLPHRRPYPLPGDPPVPHHVDGLDARGFGDLDNSLAHAAVGSVLDDRVTWI